MTRPLLFAVRTSFTIALGLLFTAELSSRSPQLSPEQRAQSKAMETRLRGEASRPAEPFRVIDYIYYVGATGISSFFIPTPQGAILIDTGTEEMLPVVRNNIEKLGFKVSDIKILLSTHAHFDHVGGHAAMKALTGAKVMALGGDAKAMEQGVDTSGTYGPGWKPVKVDRFLKHGDTVSLGGVVLKAHLTPGHTKGATTWTMTVHDGGKALNVILPGAVGITPGIRLLNTPAEKDYKQALQVLKGLHPDIFLCGHPNSCGLHEKAKRLKAGETPNPFIDPESYKRVLETYESGLKKQLEADRAAKS